LPFGTSLDLLYGGFVFLSLLCDIHSSPWLSLTNKPENYINLFQDMKNFLSFSVYRV